MTCPITMPHVCMCMCAYIYVQLQDRQAACQRFRDEVFFPIPAERMVLDSMTDDFHHAFGAWPTRVYIILDGRLVLKPQPVGCEYEIAALRDWLVAHGASRTAEVAQ